MDQRSQSAACDSIVVTGLGHVVLAPCDPTPYLKVRKNRKFMGVQDDLAVVAAGQAAASAGLGNALGERAGLYLSVGYLPFEQADVDVLFENSVDERGFSMQRFSSQAYDAVNPLLTFRCLSNMPAFHISVNLDIQGPYFVTYPGPGQFYLALEEACVALASGSIDIAFLGGIAYQQNFLVRHHFARIDLPAGRLLDAAGCVVLETATHAAARGARVRGRLLSYELSFHPRNTFEEAGSSEECGADGAMGSASLPVALSLGQRRSLRHELKTRDGICASSCWELA